MTSTINWRSVVVASLLGVVHLAVLPPVLAQLEFDSEPILYTTGAVDDPIARLQRRINDGEFELKYDVKSGYLRSLLDALDVPVSSQMLVFSKTSFQQRLITPKKPRALYFSDDVYIGRVQRGDVLEISAVDANQGAIFYTLKQQPVEKPTFVRDRGNCLTCHASSRTQYVPGHLVRSVYPDLNGQPHYGAGTFRTNHASPLAERWGGWYVTGTHGQQRHMGNVQTISADGPGSLDREKGANLADLSELVSTRPYLSGHSDIVALMVLEHQVEMHNLITHANFTTRIALHHGRSMNRFFERPDDYLSESTERRIDSAAQKLVRYMLFVDEVKLTDPIQGTSAFAEEFAARGPRDPRGRSLRDFDLQQRIFKYPCSYLIYSSAFDSLPAEVKSRVYRYLWNTLTGASEGSVPAELTAADRSAILEILRATKQDLPEYWRAKT